MLVSVPIVPTKRWVPPEAEVPRPSDEVKGVYGNGNYPNAYSTVLELLRQDNESWQFTRDKSIVEMAERYQFIYLEEISQKRRPPLYKVRLNRDAKSLPSIYLWLEEKDLRAQQLRIVPWVHPSHTCETWGICPYCEKALNHENWGKHSRAECFGFGPCDLDIVGTYPEPVQFFHWRWLVKGASDVYVCYGRSYWDADLMMPRLFVYGSEPNHIHKTGPLRTDFVIEQPIKAGTVILTEAHPDDYGHQWGVI